MFPPADQPRLAPEGGGSRSGLAAPRAELLDLRAATVGERNNRLDRAAFILGMLAAGCELDRALVEAVFLAAADIGLGETEAIASVRSGFNASPRRRPLAPAPQVRPLARQGRCSRATANCVRIAPQVSTGRGAYSKVLDRVKEVGKSPPEIA